MSVPDHATSGLSIRLFGPLEVWVNGQPLPRLRSRKVAWLLALLTLRHDQEVQRDFLMGTLWPDSPDRQASNSLRQSLTDLRRALGSESGCLVSPTVHMVLLDLSGASVDVLSFDEAIARGDTASLERAVALHRGVLLEGCGEAWVLGERETRGQSYLAALEHLAADAHAANAFALAARHLRCAIALDPLRESAQRALMETLAADGNFPAALVVYRDLRLMLRRELSAEPDPETAALFERLRDRAHQKACRSANLAPPDPAAEPTAAAYPPAPPLPPGNLPTPLTELIGRDEAVSEVLSLVRSNRLVTLVGSGGVGKTRLAIQVAQRLAEDLPEEVPEGAWFVDLSPLAAPELVPETVARAMEASLAPGSPNVQEALAAYLRPRGARLLILDNCEHLVDACASLAHDLLVGCPRLRVLATSRQSLEVNGETLWRVPSLSVPDVQSLALDENDPTALSGFAAVRLFVDRSRSVNPVFRLTAHNARAVAQICQQLDGIPLAIEMAAARVKALSVEEIARRLDDRFGLLTGGSRTALPRHQTLRATLDWSYSLLTDAERTVLRRLSVFAGGCTLEAAEAICAADGLERGAVLDHLTHLVDRNLVVCEEEQDAAGPADQTRYRLLETVRQFCLERLEGSGEREAVCARHAEFFHSFAQEAELHLFGAGQASWLRRLKREADNMRAALAWAMASEGGSEVALRMASAFFEFWSLTWLWREGLTHLEAALDREGAQERTRLRASALVAAGTLASNLVLRGTGDIAVAQRYCEEALTINRELGVSGDGGRKLLAKVKFLQRDLVAARRLAEEALWLNRQAEDKGQVVWTLINLGRITRAQGDEATARACYEESLALARDMGYGYGVQEALWNLGVFAARAGDHRAALVLLEQGLTIVKELANNCTLITDFVGDIAIEREHLGDRSGSRAILEEGLAIAQAWGDEPAACNMLLGLGWVLLAEEDFDAARSYFAESLALSQASGNELFVAHSLAGLGDVAAAQGDATEALAHYRQILSRYHDKSQERVIVVALEGIASFAALPRAAKLCGAADTLDQRLPWRTARRAQTISRIRSALGEEAFAAAWSEGQAMGTEAAIACALAEAEAILTSASGSPVFHRLPA